MAKKRRSIWYSCITLVLRKDYVPNSDQPQKAKVVELAGRNQRSILKKIRRVTKNCIIQRIELSCKRGKIERKDVWTCWFRSDQIRQTRVNRRGQEKTWMIPK